MARRTKASAEETRESILDAAEIVFYEKGVTRSSLEGIAKQAGCTRGAIYWHFRDKREVFFAMIERMKQASVSVLQAEMREPAPTDPIGKIRQAYISFSEGLYGDPRRMRLYRTVQFRCEYIDDIQDSRNLLFGASEEWLEIMRHILEHAAALGRLNPQITPPVAASLLHNLAVGSYFNNLRREDDQIDFGQDLAAFDQALSFLRAGTIAA